MRRATLILLFVLLLGISFSSCKDKKEEHPTEASSKTAEQKDIVYWTCGMHPSVRSDEPGKCPICNMDLVSVYKEDLSPEGESVISLTLSSRARKLASVRTSEITYLPLEHEIRTVGKIDWDERKLAHISSRVPGRIDKLFVDFRFALCHSLIIAEQTAT